MVQREDVAATLLALLGQPSAKAGGLALDLVQGDTAIDQAVKEAIEKGESDFRD